MWVAQKVPDGAILAHANQARTTTFDQNDPDNVMFSRRRQLREKDRKVPADASDADFDFSAAYDPVTFWRSTRRGSCLGHLPAFARQN